MPNKILSIELRPGSVDEFLTKRGFIIEKSDDRIFSLYEKFIEDFWDKKLVKINSFIYVRDILFLTAVWVVELDDKATSNDEMLGDVLMAFDLKGNLVDFRFYDSKDKTKHIWYKGNQPIPLFPGSLSIVDNSLW
jgi:hypothetical protein